MKIAEIPSNSGFSSDYDASTDIWTLTCEKNDGAAYVPFFRMNAITEKVPDKYTALCFEYRSTHDIANIDMVMYKVFLGSATKTYTITNKMLASDDWKTMRVDISSQRTNQGVRFLNKAGQYQDLRFPGLPVGGAIQVRNIRYDENEFSFKDLSLDANSGGLIEAEDFNGAADTRADTARAITNCLNLTLTISILLVNISRFTPGVQWISTVAWATRPQLSSTSSIRSFGTAASP